MVGLWTHYSYRVSTIRTNIDQMLTHLRITALPARIRVYFVRIYVQLCTDTYILHNVNVSCRPYTYIHDTWTIRNTSRPARFSMYFVRICVHRYIQIRIICAVVYDHFTYLVRIIRNTAKPLRIQMYFVHMKWSYEFIGCMNSYMNSYMKLS